TPRVVNVLPCVFLRMLLLMLNLVQPVIATLAVDVEPPVVPGAVSNVLLNIDTPSMPRTHMPPTPRNVLPETTTPVPPSSSIGIFDVRPITFPVTGLFEHDAIFMS